MSQKIGLAPRYSTTLAVETHVNAGTITSSPGFSFNAATAMCRAVVHELVAMENFYPVKSLNESSNSLTYGPCTTQPVASGFCTASSSSGPKKGLVMGTFI